MNGYWCIPSRENAEFLAAMENILDVYENPYNPSLPVVCVDEKLTGAWVKPVHSLCGFRYSYVRERRTALGWTEEIIYLLTECYTNSQKLIWVMDNLDTHVIGSLYKVYPAQEARSFAKRLEIHYTSKYGGWLNIAEIELNVMISQCLARRLGSVSTIEQELAAWEQMRNEGYGESDMTLDNPTGPYKTHLSLSTIWRIWEVKFPLITSG